MLEAIMTPPAQPGGDRAPARSSWPPPLPSLRAPPAHARPAAATLYERYANELKELKQIHLKADRNNAVKGAGQEGQASSVPRALELTPAQVKNSFHHLEEKVVRELILEGKRPDGRGPRDLRPIHLRGRRPPPRPRIGDLSARRDPGPPSPRSSEPGHDRARPGRRHHGRVQQRSFMLDYNMPRSPWARSGRSAAPGRREIAKGALRRTVRWPRSCHRRSQFPVHDPAASRHPGVERVAARWLRSAAGENDQP